MITFVKRGIQNGKKQIYWVGTDLFFFFLYEKKGSLRFLVNNNKRIN